MSCCARLALLLSVGALATGGTASAALKIGDDAPDFTLPGSDGNDTSLSTFAGERNVVLAFFPKAFTSG